MSYWIIYKMLLMNVSENELLYDAQFIEISIIELT